MDMTSKEFASLLSFFRSRRLALLPTPLSGHELRRTKAGVVQHTGIFIGKDYDGVAWVIDHSPDGVRWRSYDDYRQGEHVTATPPGFGRVRSVSAAVATVGQREYSLPFMNCQHFTSLAAQGKSFSSAVRTLGLLAACAFLVTPFAEPDERSLLNMRRL